MISRFYTSAKCGGRVHHIVNIWYKCYCLFIVFATYADCLNIYERPNSHKGGEDT